MLDPWMFMSCERNIYILLSTGFGLKNQIEPIKELAFNTYLLLESPNPKI